MIGRHAEVFDLPVELIGATVEIDRHQPLGTWRVWLAGAPALPQDPSCRAIEDDALCVYCGQSWPCGAYHLAQHLLHADYRDADPDTR